MNLKEYEIESQRTFAYRQLPLNESRTDLLHCAIGICTEAGELIEALEENDKINVAEEIADQMWYASNLLRMIYVDVSTINFITTTITGIEFTNKFSKQSVVLSSQLLDLFKKSIYYGKDLDLYEVKKLTIHIINNLMNLSNSLELNIEKLLDNNINKLRIRFPEKFSKENALNRDLDSERKELEK